MELDDSGESQSESEPGAPGPETVPDTDIEEASEDRNVMAKRKMHVDLTKEGISPSTTSSGLNLHQLVFRSLTVFGSLSELRLGGRPKNVYDIVAAIQKVPAEMV